MSDAIEKSFEKWARGKTFSPGGQEAKAYRAGWVKAIEGRDLIDEVFKGGLEQAARAVVEAQAAYVEKAKSGSIDVSGVFNAITNLEEVLGD